MTPLTSRAPLSSSSSAERPSETWDEPSRKVSESWLWVNLASASNHAAPYHFYLSTSTSPLHTVFHYHFHPLIKIIAPQSNPNYTLPYPNLFHYPTCNNRRDCHDSHHRQQQSSCRQIAQEIRHQEVSNDLILVYLPRS